MKKKKIYKKLKKISNEVKQLTDFINSIFAPNINKIGYDYKNNNIKLDEDE